AVRHAHPATTKGDDRDSDIGAADVEVASAARVADAGSALAGGVRVSLQPQHVLFERHERRSRDPPDSGEEVDERWRPTAERKSSCPVADVGEVLPQETALGRELVEK